MAITPDTKDWTWVLERPCAECGFDASTFDANDASRLIRENAEAWPAVLLRADVAVRPDANTWSPLEYAAHVRDVYRLGQVRIGLMLTEDDPIYPNWDQNATAVEERYGEQDPAAVSRELLEAASALAEMLDRVTGEQWPRPGRRSDGARFTVGSFAKYVVHDPVHHLWDVRE